MGELGKEKEELLIEKQHLVELVADLWKDLDYREEVVRMKPDEVEMADDVEMNSITRLHSQKVCTSYKSQSTAQG